MTVPSSAATIVSMFCDRVAADAQHVALHVPRNGRFEQLTWTQVARQVNRSAALLASLGVQRGDRVALVSPNRYEWIVADLAIQLAQAVHVPIHASLSGPQIVFQVVDSEAVVLLLSCPEQARKLIDRAGELPASLHVLCFDPVDFALGKLPVRRCTELVANVSDAQVQVVVQQALAQVKPDDLATILYTSGTTGEPKGVMLTQGNLASNAIASLTAFGQHGGDLRLGWLPLSHIFARTCDLYTWIAAGSQLALAESAQTVVADCAKVRPTLINGVPYFFEKLQRHLIEEGKANTPGALQQLLGGRLRSGCSGGAPLPEHVGQFYQDQGVMLYQGYGLTESSPVISTCSELGNKLGTVGRAVPGVEVRIAEDGEVLTRGPHVMKGYWKRPEATAEVLQGGWLYTGDLGELDDDGYLRITGRKKELIVTSAGKNIAPTYLEALLAADPLIRQAVVIGDGRKYLTALIVVEPDDLQEEIRRRKISVSSFTEGLTHPEVCRLYRQRITERLSGMSRYEQVQKFTLLDREFSVDAGELTLTLKLRRQAIQANFAEQIAAMYEAEP